MQPEIVFLARAAPEGGYIAQAVSHLIFTEADSMEELKNQVRDAVMCHFDSSEGPASIRCVSYATQSSLFNLTA